MKYEANNPNEQNGTERTMSHFYFAAQTGTIRDSKPLAPSNFYCYRLPERARATVQRAVDSARVTDCGLEYAPKFLTFLGVADCPEKV